jgi:hypothetical protein
LIERKQLRLHVDATASGGRSSETSRRSSIGSGVASQKIAEIVGQRMKLEANSVGGERPDPKSCDGFNN